MDRLLEATARAERDHFWFRGFRRFVQPLLAEAARSSRTLLALDCEVRRYHRRELRDHLVRTGFQVRRITYTNFTLLPLVAAVRFPQSLSDPKSRIVRSASPPPRSARSCQVCWPPRQLPCGWWTCPWGAHCWPWHASPTVTEYSSYPSCMQ